MRNNRLQGIVTAGRWTLPAVIFICIICWIATGFMSNINYLGSANYAPLGIWSEIVQTTPLWTNKIAGFVLYAAMGYFLIEMNNVFGIIRMRASVQTSLYFLFITACPSLHLLYPGDIASVTFLISLFFLFKCYHLRYPASNLFLSFAFMGMGTLFFPQLVFFIPLWLAGAIKFQAFTLRSFCAALVGFTFPYWFLFGHAFFYQKMELFYQPFTEMFNFYPIDYKTQMPLWEILTLAYLFILYITSIIHYAQKGYQDKIQVRSYLDFLFIVSLYTFAFIGLQPDFAMNLLPILLVPISFLTAHFFVLTNTKGSNLFFICATIGLILLFAFNLWILL